MDVRAPLVPDSKASVLMQPSDRSLNHPAVDVQSAPMCRVPARDEGADPPEPKGDAMGIGVVAAIRVRGLRPGPRSSTPAAKSRDRVHERAQLADVRSVRRREVNDQRNPIAVGDDVVLAPWTAAIDGTWAAFFPPRPLTARGRSRPRSAPSRSGPPDAGARGARDAAASRRPPAASLGGGASRSCRNPSPVPGEGPPTGSRSSARRGSRSARLGSPCASARRSASGASVAEEAAVR